MIGAMAAFVSELRHPPRPVGVDADVVGWQLDAWQRERLCSQALWAL
jgi:hypothetical protein